MHSDAAFWFWLLMNWKWVALVLLALIGWGVWTAARMLWRRHAQRHGGRNG